MGSGLQTTGMSESPTNTLSIPVSDSSTAAAMSELLGTSGCSVLAAEMLGWVVIGSLSGVASAAAAPTAAAATVAGVKRAVRKEVGGGLQASNWSGAPVEECASAPTGFLAASDVELLAFAFDVLAVMVARATAEKGSQFWPPLAVAVAVAGGEVGSELWRGESALMGSARV